MPNDHSSAITPRSGSVTTLARLNIRRGAPATTAPIAAKVEPGTQLAVEGSVRGENVRGNDAWYAGGGDTYFWSGAVSDLSGTTTTHTTANVLRRPDGTIRALAESQVRTVFGDVRTTEAGGGRVRLEPAWVQENLTRLETPVLASLGYPQIEVHVKARDPFRRVFEAIVQAGLADRLLTCAGTFVPRHKGWDPNRGLSPHTWGIAIDLNVAWNGYGAEPAALGTTGSLRELVPLFEAEGFAWGGYFAPDRFRDGMHFELARLDL